jgi:hypothetical protein
VETDSKKSIKFFSEFLGVLNDKANILEDAKRGCLKRRPLFLAQKGVEGFKMEE